MTPDGRKRGVVALVAALSIGFALLAHAAVVRGVPVGVGAAVSIVPVALLLSFALRRLGPALRSGAIVTVIALAAWLAWPQIEAHFPDLLFVEHLALNLTLGIIFGRTLLPGEDPLVARFARVVHGELPPDVAQYTRKVTIAWTAFFAAVLLASCALYLTGMKAAWSFFANILSPVLLAAMFVVEYAIRHRVLPNLERIGILGGVRAFVRHFQAARFEAPR